MLKVGIYGQYYHEDSENSIKQIFNVLHQKNVSIHIEENFLKLTKENKQMQNIFSDLPTFSKLDKSFDLFFSIGGDGTTLRAITFIRDLDIPIVAINTGRLGFMATLQKENIVEGLEQILNGDYILSKRSLLSAKTDVGVESIEKLNIALNEITVNRKDTTSMIEIYTEIDGYHITSYWADGLIVSTPTGSTGYSLSCGGPILNPSTSSLVITPIAPHNLNARPLVIPDSSTVTLRVFTRSKSFLTSLDARIAALPNGASIEIKKAPYTISLVQLTENSFFDTLQKKMLWGEDKRN
ncbi:MAG TPA: NAD kinase [Flavobacteriaceae bacterium]|nr:NAD kinase [Flavobacteriaceae bacterium]